LTTLTTARLVLRQPRLDDLDALFAIMSTPAAMRYWSTVPHGSRETTAILLDKILASTAAGGQEYMIERDGQFIGKVGAGLLPHFGFIIDPAHWGQGYATEASQAYIAHVFSVTEAHKLVADVDPRNTASLRVLNRLGFTETGRAERTFLLGDEWCDSIYLQLDRPPGHLKER